MSFLNKSKKEDIYDNYYKSIEKLKQNPEYMGAMPEVRAIVKFDEEDSGISTDLFNKIVLETGSKRKQSKHTKKQGEKVE